MTDSTALPDLTLGDCADRWQISRNSIKARAVALGVQLRRESSTRTVWPGEHLDLGDALHQHLQRPKATLANYSGPRLEPLPAAPLAASEHRSLPSAPAGSGEAMAAMVAMVAAMRPSLPPPDPLATVEALHRAVELGVWLTSDEVSKILGPPPMPDTVTSWPDGHQLRPGLFMQRQKFGGLVWWRIVREAD